MRVSQVPLEANNNLKIPRSVIPRACLVAGLGSMLLMFGLLVVGLCVAPEWGVLGLAGIGIGIPLLAFVWFRPEFGLLTLIFLTSSFVPADVVDIRLPIGGGLDLRDLVLLGLFGLLFVRELVRKTISVPWWKVGGPLALFLILATVSVFYAIIFRNVESHWALSDLRILISYVIFIMVIWGIQRLDQLQILIVGLFIIADLTTAVVVLQQFVGVDNPLLQAMTTTRDWRVYQEVGGLRVIPAGQLLMHFMWLISLGLLVFTRSNPARRAFLVFQLVFIGAGHILTYMRAQWVAMFLGSCLIGLVIADKNRHHLPKYSVLGLSILFILVLFWGTIGLSAISQIPFISGVEDRFVSLLTPAETMQTSSLEWRKYENGKALESILKRPLLGVGLGGRYRELTTLQGEALGLWTRGSLAAGEVSRFTRYVHNSYLSIAVKMGIPGLIVMLWFLIAFLINGSKIYQDSHVPEFKGIVLGVIAGFTGLLVWSLFHAHFIKAESTPTIGLMVGLIAVIGSLNKL